MKFSFGNYFRCWSHSSAFANKISPYNNNNNDDDIIIEFKMTAGIERDRAFFGDDDSTQSEMIKLFA